MTFKIFLLLVFQLQFLYVSGEIKDYKSAEEQKYISFILDYTLKFLESSSTLKQEL